MKVWITAEPWPATPEVEAAAAAAGADTIWHGIPAGRADELPAGTLGLYELAEPVAVEHVDPLHQLAAAIVAATTIDDVKPAALAILTGGDT